MKKLALAASLLVLAAVASAQQQKPNFSGTWVVVTPAEHAGQEETISHHEHTLRLGHGASHGGDHSEVFTLDGSPHKSSMPSHGSEIHSVSTASWNGDQLVVFRSSRYPDGRAINSKLTFSLNAEGHLVRQITDTVEGKDQPTVTVVMKRK